MRLFVAINLNKDTKKRLLALRDELSSRSERGSFTMAENLHLTLAFLGECDIKQAAAAKAAVDAVPIEPFDLVIERLGRFKGRGDRGAGGEDIWWAGVRENAALLDMQRELTVKLIAAGFSLDTRKYSPHITLGRRVVTDAVPRRIEPFGETVGKIDLMLSERVGGRLTYTKL